MRRFGIKPSICFIVILLLSVGIASLARSIEYQKPQAVKRAVKNPPVHHAPARTTLNKPEPVTKAPVKADKKIANVSAGPGRGPSNEVPITGETATYLRPLSELLAEKHINNPQSVELYVEKAAHVVKLVVNGELIKTYMAATGKNTGANKVTRGDHATPVGDYYVCEKNPRSRYYAALKLAYPNASDADRGLSCGLIDKGTCNKIRSAISARRAPPMDTALGGNICIHGNGAGEMERSGNVPLFKVRNWTAGCIALDNNQMKELFDFVPAGTPVYIRA